jgi:hypothetical protein
VSAIDHASDNRRLVLVLIGVAAALYAIAVVGILVLN